MNLPEQTPLALAWRRFVSKFAAIMNWITLLEQATRVESLEGVVYSTDPRRALAIDNHSYILKGPDVACVVAEVLGYELATLAGVPVPAWALCRLGSDVYFASRECRQRNVTPLLGTPLVSNPGFLESCIALDVWIGNKDRHVSNIVAEPIGGLRDSAVELRAIDFEKAEVLCGKSRFVLSETRVFGPNGELRNWLPRPFPGETCSRIASVSDRRVEQLLAEITAALPGRRCPMTEFGVATIAHRAEAIESLVKELWNAN